MNMRRILCSAVLAICCLAVGSSARAQCGGAYGLGAYGGFWDIGRLYGILADEVPYYAAFPPVYYSFPVPRTYGYSPFAYPPGVMTPEVEIVQPETIENPYFKPEEVPQPAADQPAATPTAVDQTTSVVAPGMPLVIMNPYFHAGANGAARVTPTSFTRR